MNDAFAAAAGRLTRLRGLIAERIVILDGATGTMVQSQKLDEADYRGHRFKDHGRDLKGNADILNLTQPDLVAGLHREYFEAGADILTVEIKINYVTLAAGEALIARGEVIKSGRTLTIVRSEVFAVKDGVETLCAAGQGSLMTRKP